MKAVIFDRDGTLLDFRDMYVRFMQDLHAAQALDAPDADSLLRYEVWESIMCGDLHVGVGAKRLLDQAVELG